MSKERNWTVIGVGLEVLAGVIVAIDPMLAIPVSIGGAAAIFYGVWPEQCRRFFRRNPEVGIAAEVKRDISLLDAIHRAATGEWKVCDFDELAEGKINEFVGVLEKIQQAAFDGDLPIWGKQARSDVWRPIPPEYWEYHGIDWFSMLKGEPENLKTEAKKTTRNVGVWWELMTSRKRVDELWPTKTKDEALRELGGLREEGVHFRENAASQRVLLQADLEKIKAFEATIIENVEIISPGEVTNFRVIDTFDPTRHPAHVQGKLELLLFSERLRRLGEFITAHSRR